MEEETLSLSHRCRKLTTVTANPDLWHSIVISSTVHSVNYATPTNKERPSLKFVYLFGILNWTRIINQRQCWLPQRGPIQFKVMPFGLYNVPFTIERLMETLLTWLQCHHYSSSGMLRKYESRIQRTLFSKLQLTSVQMISVNDLFRQYILSIYSKCKGMRILCCVVVKSFAL